LFKANSLRQPGGKKVRASQLHEGPALVPIQGETSPRFLVRGECFAERDNRDEKSQNTKRKMYEKR